MRTLNRYVAAHGLLFRVAIGRYRSFLRAKAQGRNPAIGDYGVAVEPLPLEYPEGFSAEQARAILARAGIYPRT